MFCEKKRRNHFLLALIIFIPVFNLQGSFLSSAWAKEDADLSSFQLQPGDKLEIQVFREEDLTGTYQIDPSGRLNFPLLGDMKAAGLKVEELRKTLSQGLKKYLIDPQVTIARSEASIKSISVLGHVKNPGTFDYAPGATLMRLISQAGGFAPSANKRKIKIVRVAPDGGRESIMVNALDIVNGKGDDVTLEAGDMIFVPESIF